MEQEGVIREALPGNEAEGTAPDPLDWTEAEQAAMSGKADEEMPYKQAKREAAELAAAVPEEAPESEAVASDEGDTSEPEGDDAEAAAFLDTRERKESYTPEEWEKLVKQRDYFQRRETELTNEIGTVSERVERLAGVLEQQHQEPPPAPPPKTEDPAGYLEHKIAGVVEKVDGLAGTIEEERAAAQARAAQAAFEQASNNATAMYCEAAELTPDEFQGRLEKVREQRYEDFLEEGFDSQKALRLLAGWENQIIAAAFQRGENPAEVLDRRYRRSFSGGPPSADAPETTATGDTNGPNPHQVIEKAKKGRKMQRKDTEFQRGKSFTVTYDSLAKMAPDEFNEVMDQLEGTTKEDELDMTGSTSVLLK